LIGVGGSSYSPEIAVPPDEPESEQEFVMRDEDVTQFEEWDDPQHLPPTDVSVISVG
jgi:hypothetical protein